MDTDRTSKSSLASKRPAISRYFSTLSFCIPDIQSLRDKVCTFSKHRTLRFSHTEIRLIKGVTKGIRKCQELRGAKGQLPRAEQVSPRCSSEPPGRLPSRPPQPLPWKPHTALWLLHPQGVRRQCWQGHLVCREQQSKSLGSWPS